MTYLDNLNEKQKEAVTCSNKYIRVVAGAGSGKTKVLTSRISYLMDNGVDPNKILAITFTNKASKEMKDRVLRSIGENIYGSPIISTFHSFCARFLREEINVLGYSRDFNIIDEEDKVILIKKILKEKNIDKDYLNHKTVINYISYLKTFEYKGIKTGNVLNKEKEKDKKNISNEYNHRLEKMGSLDFDDLLLKTYQILMTSDEIRNKWQKRFNYILVDEFQDTNDIQFDLVRLLVGKDNHLFVVGDPDQTIYTWRGANLNIIMEFNDLFENAKTIILDTNYRSTKRILECANTLIKNNKNRVSKDLIAYNSDGEGVYYKGSVDGFSEADFVVQTIIKEKEKYSYDYKNFAILYRANYLSREVESALIRNNIPYKIYGGVKFYERKEVKDSLAYLRVLVNKKDDISLARIINEPKRGVGETLLDKFREIADNSDTSLYETIKENLDECTRKEARNNLKEFFEIIEKYSKQVEQQVELENILDGILKDVEYYNMLEENDEEYRAENIKELMNNMMYFGLNSEEATLSAFLQEVTLLTSQDEIDNGDHVNLMTVHTAKGLEFKSVFVVGMCEGIFPSVKSLEENEENLEEERRLAYVAFTRAMEHLHLSSNRGINYVVHSNNTPSRFIKEVSDLVVLEQTPTITKQYKKPTEKAIKVTKPTNSIEWKVGDKLNHIVYGPGIVLSVSGDLINIAFKDPEFGVKMLLGKHGSLSKV